MHTFNRFNHYRSDTLIMLYTIVQWRNPGRSLYSFMQTYVASNNTQDCLVQCIRVSFYFAFCKNKCNEDLELLTQTDVHH